MCRLLLGTVADGDAAQHGEADHVSYLLFSVELQRCPTSTTIHHGLGTHQANREAKEASIGKAIQAYKVGP